MLRTVFTNVRESASKEKRNGTSAFAQGYSGGVGTLAGIILRSGMKYINIVLRAAAKSVVLIRQSINSVQRFHEYQLLPLVLLYFWRFRRRRSGRVKAKAPILDETAEFLLRFFYFQKFP